MLRIGLLLIALFCSTFLQAQEYKSYPMWDPSLTTEQRVDDLVSRMTLEEKVMQMMNEAPAIPRLGVPAYDWWNETLHGVARTPFKTTVFPQAIGMAATWDTASLKLMAHYAGIEGRAINNRAVAEGNTKDRYLGLTYWTPNINIFRDPRWGRGQETYGEDPYLTSKLGAAFVRGLQGDDPRYLLAAACAKHYAVHSGPEPSRHVDNVTPSTYDLWDTYLPAFRELVVNAKVAGVMCAYNSLNSQPCCGNDLLMTDILRNQWHFQGYVTSDCGAIEDFIQTHKTHKDAASAAADAVFHGTDIECGKNVYPSLVDAVKSGLIDEKKIDVSVKRLFTIRFRLGMFDPKEIVPYAQIPISKLEAPEHQALALKMARESVVLLKNGDNILPLSKSLKQIAVIGPNADNRTVMLGNYNGTPSRIVSVLDGIKAEVSAPTEVVYIPGVNYVGEQSLADMNALVKQASAADVIVFVGGISPELEGEEMQVHAEGFKGGDRTSIMLPAIQTTLLKHLYDTGKPVIFVMLTGSAIAIPWEQQNLPAIINAWYGGQSGGTAVADVLFGDYNPAGRLPVTFYKSDKDLPDFKDYNMAGRTYRYFNKEVLYPFGYGLSYSTFRYSNFRLPHSIKKGSPLTVYATVTNTGPFDGDEVAQLYLSYPSLKQKAPRLALKGFQRFHLKKGEHANIKFRVTSDELSLVNEQGEMYEPSGKLLVSVGGGQPGVKLHRVPVVQQEAVLIK
jgi:beta-glucosidase